MRKPPVMQIPGNYWHLCDLKDGKNRPFRVVKKLRIESRCPNIEGCFVTYDGLHVQNLYEDRADVPRPKFENYNCVEEEENPPS
jgi:hypothetical protein